MTRDDPAAASAPGRAGPAPRSAPAARAREAAALLLTVLVAGVLPAGCASGGGGSLHADDAAYGAPTAEAAVEAFLAAIRADDYPAMARYFGTPSGPAEEKWGVEEVEQRMLVLAGLLDHESADLRRARRSVTDEDRRQFVLSLTGTRYGSVTLPVVVARWQSGRWLVEQLDTSALSP